MLSEERNRQLTPVGPGTPMGEVLRRHWHPVAGVDALAREPIHPLRLLGEDLAPFRTLQGFIFHAGRPAAVRQACEAALGVPQREITIIDP